MKIYLDDDDTNRQTPEGFIRCHWPEEVITFLKTESVDELSLDHDLGDKDAALAEKRKERTGYDVLVWLENNTRDGNKPPKIVIHSANTVAKQRMNQAIKKIADLWLEFLDYRIEFKEQVKLQHTKKLIEQLHARHDAYYPQSRIEFEREAILAELAIRPHVPNKQESRQARLDKIKKGR